ncbi:peptidoglycan/LPS O-acetylase OafA/YrhL [Nocardioides sp. BE266]|uniref:acyltransferase family protein n=1 Tax=Nocardioides sp. BE266 TaxID=2817725 RepID=UPI002866E096|nr:acyltransferase [Nocardioides sp. BE266]MDR7254559.1 peptidoglycan/LPS O-acetylase OafA/YrhL [Nocardioides sp. BE266]
MSATSLGAGSAAPVGDVATSGMNTSRRVALIDGIRGVAIVLVVLSHGWVIWPIERIDETAWIRPLFRSGNFAVTVFLVAAGYLAYVSLASRGLEHTRPGVTFVRRVLRVGPSLWLLLAAVLVVSTLDSTDKTASEDNVDSVWHVLTYTWNWYVQGNLLTSRPDFGHLWYLSVDMQAFVVMAAVLYMMRRRPVGVLFVLGGLLLLLTWWRFHVTDTEFVFQVLVRTTARMDPFVVGVMLGAALPLVRRLDVPQWAVRWTATATLVALVPLAYYCSRDERFLAWGVTLLELDLALLFGATALLTVAPRPVTVMSARPLAFLGRHSLLLYIWHYPVFTFLSRHTEDWAWVPRTVVALVLTVLISLLAHRLVERRATELLRHPAWAEADGGLLPLVRGRALSVWTAARQQVTRA